MADQSVTLWKDAPAASASGEPVSGSAAVICFSFSVGSSSILVMKDRVEVCSLSREVLFQPLFSPLQDDLCFFHIPLPTIPSAHLAVAYRTSGDNGLTVFRVSNQVG